jgi:RNA polymerase sigma-70 factor (ECF subfamily)
VSALATDEARLTRALRDGDEQAFALLVDRYHAPLLRVAMIYVKNRSVAEEVVQETWLAVIRGVDPLKNPGDQY